jgi:hypothetical protein
MRQSNHNHSAHEEAARVRKSHIQHTKGGGDKSDSDCVFVELAYKRFLKPRPDVASFEYDSQHRAFIDKTLKCSLLASRRRRRPIRKAAAGATFARKTPDRPAPDRPTPNRTPRPQPKPKLPPRNNAESPTPIDSKTKNPDKNE